MEIKDLTPEQSRKFLKLESGHLETSKEYLYEKLGLPNVTNKELKEKAMEGMILGVLLTFVFANPDLFELEIKKATPDHLKKLVTLISGGFEAVKEHIYEKLSLPRYIPEQGKERAEAGIIHDILMKYILTCDLL